MTHKATLIGNIIQISTQIKKVHQIELTRLGSKLLSLCKAHKGKCDREMLSKIGSTRLALNLALTTRAEKSLRWSSARFFLLMREDWSYAGWRQTSIVH